ncbi:hypothetical protein [Ralstonia sp. ASV6]|uniref:gp53-like domain-containing protein n=1 Tax=Ralstonia sp. ASV6 TaxID=2795124 RepID=UPI0018EA5985|nr:hypothetical protein [Ralstonia sp. ASV6]
MHRIDGAGNVNGTWVAEDPATNRPPTEITAAIMNALQEELAGLIEWAGLGLAKADNTQLRQALLAKFALINSPTFTGQPAAPTPAQFDTSTKLANMAAVQRALGSFSGFVSFNAGGSPALTAANAGNEVILTGTASGTLYLPQIATVTAGTAFLVKVESSAQWYVATGGTDGSIISLNGGSAASLQINQDDFILFIAGGGFWRTFGTGLLKYSGSFASSLATNGFQKLPSGRIVQWGNCTPTISGDAVVTFPIQFPTAIYSFVVAASATSGSAGFANYNGIALSGVNVGAYLASGARAGFTCSWYAVGK